jgi:uncharacterized protein (UPF0261 family)
MKGRRVVVLATLDTKHEEAMFVAERVRRHGLTPLLVDTGTRGQSIVAGDITGKEIAAAAGIPQEALAGMKRADAFAAVVRGASSIVRSMVDQQEVHAVIGIGGGQGTWISCNIMMQLPLGFPKLMLSTAAARTAAIYASDNDIMMMSSITDISGLNRIFRPILANAVAAVCGMASQPPLVADTSRPLLAMTMFGVTTRGATAARAALEQHGYEVAVFHANGFGGRMLETLAAQGMFAGIVDFTTTELTDDLVGGIASAGAERLTAAGRRGLPQVVVPGAIDVVNLGDPAKIKSEFASRTIHLHRANSALMRADVAESKKLGTLMAEKLNAATGPARVIVPAKGFSALDVAGGPFELPEADAAFTKALQEALRPDVGVEVLDLHINDPEFAARVAEAFIGLAATASRPAECTA